MRSNRYSHNKAKNNFRTKEIVIRGFVRDLKSRLLSGQDYSLENGEYSLVAEAFEEMTGRIDISLLDEFYDEEKGTYEISFVESSCYSKWWNGLQYPFNRNKKKLIEILFPGLLSKWFERSNFRNRLQLHLASMDLFVFSKNCNCKEKIDFRSYCENCLSEALEEAKSILEAIHSDWKPEYTRYLKAFDICISGPEQRAGLNVWKNHVESSLSHEKSDVRECIDFDLSLDGGSNIGIQLPKEIADLYQDENLLSVVQFLFTLVGLNLHAESEYRDDLILDFMTAMNCAGFYLSVKHGMSYSPTAGFFDEKLQEMLIHSSEYFYDEPMDINAALVEYELLTKRELTQSSITYPITLFDCHSGYQLTELFFELIRVAIKRDDVRTYLENLKEICHPDNEHQSLFDKYLEQPFLRVFKSFEAARVRYLNHFKITGYSQKELISELSKTIQNPVGKKTLRGATSHKKAVYSNKFSSF